MLDNGSGFDWFTCVHVVYEYSEALPEWRAQNKTPGLCFLTVDKVGPLLSIREFLYQKQGKWDRMQMPKFG